MLGHKSATMTLDLYVHLFENRLERWPTGSTRQPEPTLLWPKCLPKAEVVRIETARSRCARRYRPENSGPPSVPPAGFGKICGRGSFCGPAKMGHLRERGRRRRLAG